MTILKVLVIASLALVAGAIAEQARADQIFLCEDGRQLRVALGDLERMKHGDSCVGRHFGAVMTNVDRRTPAPSSAGKAERPVLREIQKDRERHIDQNVRVDLSNVVILNAGHGAKAR